MLAAVLLHLLCFWTNNGAWVLLVAQPGLLQSLAAVAKDASEELGPGADLEALTAKATKAQRVGGWGGGGGGSQWLGGEIKAGDQLGNCGWMVGQCIFFFSKVGS